MNTAQNGTMMIDDINATLCTRMPQITTSNDKCLLVIIARPILLSVPFSAIVYTGYLIKRKPDKCLGPNKLRKRQIATLDQRPKRFKWLSPTDKSDI